MKRLIISLSILLFAATSMQAESLTKEQQLLLKQRAAQKVSLFTGYITKIADKVESLEHRLYFKDAALKLFIGKGQSYNEYYIQSNGQQVKVERDGVKMQVTSVRTGSKRDLLMRSYLYNLANLKYSKVEVQTTDVAHMRVSNIEKVGKDTYRCVCFFKQSFVGYKDGVPVYRDITEKKVECIINGIDTPDGYEYEVFLGDVTAAETQSINGEISPETIRDIVNS